MKTIRQLLRQPLKYLFGVLLMGLAVAVLCVCIGQSLAAKITKADLDSRFSTAAILSMQEDLEGLNIITVEQELIDWLDEMAALHPDIVKGVIRHGILSAAIPELVPYNPVAESVPIVAQGSISNPDGPTANFNGYTSSSNYDSAMLVITLEEIGQVRAPGYQPDPVSQPSRGDYATGEEYEAAWVPYEAYCAEKSDLSRNRNRGEGYSIRLTGTVTQVVSLQDGLRNPEGMTAQLTVIMPTQEDIQALNLQIGQQYIVYSMDYNDDYRDLVTFMKSPYSGYAHISFEPFDPTMLKEPTQQQKVSYAYGKHMYVEMLYNYVPLTPAQYDALNAVSMTVCMPSNLIKYKRVYDDYNNLVEILPQTSVSFQDGEGNTVTMGMEEYNSLYRVPTIAKLDGTVEDFLNSADGAAWQAALQRDAINHHAFTVIGVENMDCLAAFALGKSKMGEGREFTSEEVASGAKVCIIHEKVAEMAGLQLGDTITLSFYATEHGQPYAETRNDDAGLLCPAASLYTTTSSILETAEYTVVGFWQGEVNPDATENYYSFDANTVFVPQSSVGSAMEVCNTLPFVSGKLENGTINAFHKLAKSSGYAGRFKYSDQGYSEIAANFHNYADLARQILRIGLGLYGMVLILFLLLYPGAMKKPVRTMQSLGCTFGRRLRHVLVSSLAVMIPATVLGGLLGDMLWERVVDALQTTAESTIALQLEPDILAQIAAAQLVLAVILNMLAAALVAAPRGMASRR